MATYFFVKHVNKYLKVNFKDVILIESCKNYSKIVTANKFYLALVSLKAIEESFPKLQFCRVHRSYIVSIDQVISFDNSTVDLPNRTVPIGDAFKGILEKRFIIAHRELMPFKNSFQNDVEYVGEGDENEVEPAS